MYIQLRAPGPDQKIINRIFEQYGLGPDLVELLKSKPGQYLAIDGNREIAGVYPDFDAYLSRAEA